jgi:tRNA G18 (ribose-2'-O)-methylase SpoU
LARRRLEGIREIESARAHGAPIGVVLRREGTPSAEARALLDRLRAEGVAILEESDREMCRMSGGRTPPELVALEGAPPPSDLAGAMGLDGPLILLVGLRYPGNVGFIIRSAEVAGVAGVLLAGDWARGQRERALRVGMRADRFLPVLDVDAAAAFAGAREAGRRIIALETGGQTRPWETDLRGPLLLVVGGETSGIPADLLAEVDVRVTIPARGFIPSYNVQAAVGIALGEWLRQTDADRRSVEEPADGRGALLSPPTPDRRS